MAENEQIGEYEDEESPKGIFRWMSSLVVVAAIAGFLALAWYAYKSGGDNVDEKDVELIKADKTPIKETPANPGGMEIPHQDKTVYGLISGDHADKPNVERVLPAPEEPVTHTDEAETWMNDKVKNKAALPDAGATSPDAATSEAIATAVVGDQKTAASDATPSASETRKSEQFNPAKAAVKTSTAPAASQREAIAIAPVPVNKNAATPQVAPKATDVPSPKEVTENKDANDDTAAEKVATAPVAIKPLATPEAPPAKAKADATPSAAITASTTTPATPAQAVTKPAAAPAATTTAPVLPKGTLIQLGAYKSEKEAQTDWGRISRAFPDELSKRQHYVVKVNLSKGTFYRLQAGPFASTEEGEQFCLGLVSAGQGCLIAHDK